VAVTTPFQISVRRVIGIAFAALAGGVLLFASRRLAWGRDQSLADWPLWIIAIVPYCTYFGITRYSALRLAALVKQSDFLWIWAISLIAFVVMRSSSLSRLYENGIYDTIIEGIWRYASISAIYVGFGFLAVTSWRLLFGPYHHDPGSMLARALGVLVAFVLFCSGVFLIEP